MPSNPSLLFADESDEEIYERLLDDLESPPGGQPLNVRPGSNIYTLLRPMVTEHRRIKDFGESITRLGFLQYSQGAFLDAKALEYGAERNDPVAAMVLLTFNGVEGTVIPNGTVAATTAYEGVESVNFITQNTVTIPVSGTVDVVAVAQYPGAEGNVSPGAIDLMVTPIQGVTSVINDTSGTGGLDEEDDESLRDAALTRARSIPQSGNKATYVILAMDDPEVGTAYVEDFWDITNGMDGNGSAKVIVGGYDNSWVSPLAIDRLQELIDPTIKSLAHFEQESWVGGDIDVANPIEGYSSRVLEAVASTTETMALTRESVDLSRWNDLSNDEIWIDLRRESAANTIQEVEIVLYNGSGESATAVLDGTTDINPLPNITTEAMAKVTLDSFVLTSNFVWADISEVSISLTATVSGTAKMVFDGMRVRRARGGFLAGQAPVGVQILVRSARSLFFDVFADVDTDEGVILSDIEPGIHFAINEYFSLLAPGSVVRMSKIANAIHDVIGVRDYKNISVTTSFGSTSDNVILVSDQRPVLNSLTLSDY